VCAYALAYTGRAIRLPPSMHRAAFVLFALLTPSIAVAQTDAAPASFAGQPVLNLGLLAILSLLPILFMTCTSFAKMSIVFALVRNALGTGQVPSGPIIAALSALLTLYVMSPVAHEAYVAAAPSLVGIDTAAPVDQAGMTRIFDGLERGAAPLRAFLERNAGRRERALFADLARRSRPADQRAGVTASDLLVVMPAFLVTELGEAFQIGFIVFVPFLVIDMVVANVLLALGMHMLSPTTVSMPFKLLLFVMVDGFYLLARALVLGYA
jgi:type III secretion protein R